MFASVLFAAAPSLPRLPTLGLPGIVAVLCNDRAPAHPRPRPELAAKNGGDRCRVFRPVSPPLVGPVCGVPRIVAARGHGRPAAHLPPQIELAGRTGGDCGRPLRPVPPRTPMVPCESGEHRKKKRGPGPFGAGFSAIPSGFRRPDTARTGTKGPSNRRVSTRNQRTDPRRARFLDCTPKGWLPLSRGWTSVLNEVTPSPGGSFGPHREALAPAPR